MAVKIVQWIANSDLEKQKAEKDMSALSDQGYDIRALDVEYDPTHRSVVCIVLMDNNVRIWHRVEGDDGTVHPLISE